MLPDSAYRSARMAAGYAFSRPPVHAHIVRKLREDLRLAAPIGRALDVGCGAGRSTAPLVPLARLVVGLEPVSTMLEHRRAVAPGAAFVVGRAERLPFCARTFDLVTAAGSLNYVDLPLFLADLARLLSPRGTMVVYDFSAGRRLRGDGRLDAWYEAFEHRHPPGPGYDMDVTALDYASHGLRLSSFEAFEVAVPMTLDEYVRYVMSETGVELAIAAGAPEGEVKAWCESTLAGILDGVPRDVLFDAYVAYVRHAQ